MHRSSSSCRVSDEFCVKSSTLKNTETEQEQGRELLPTYNPLSHAAMKERSRLRSAENAVHLIPLVLLLCAVILWFFSIPESRE